jgi:predicted amidohydrolase YtcJ
VQRLQLLLALATILMTPPAPVDAQAAPEIAVVNARVWTGDARRPWADALVASGGRIVQVGSSAEARKLTGPSTRVVDAGGALVVPGFNDAHVHFIEGGFRLSSVQLRDARTPAEFARRIADFAATVPAGTWIVGGDWDHEQWGGDLPQREWIDSLTPDHPVWVSRLDGHMALANTAAMRMAGVDATTADVAGGTIVRGESGVPTGVFKDNAMSLVRAVVTEPSAELKLRALEAAMRHVAGQGVTSVQHMGSWDDMAVFERARSEGRLRTRIYAAVPISTWERLRDHVAQAGRGDEWLSIGALKGFMDGSLGSHTAAMLEAFSDTPADSGFFVVEPQQMKAWIAGADAAGLHPVIHAIGDRANRVLLDIFEEVSRENGVRDRRFKVEHAQHLHPDDIPRFARLGVVASMQPYHAIDDGRWAEKVIGAERARGTYAFRWLLDAGAKLAFGSDWFVAPPTPLEGIYAAVTRRTLDDGHPGGWVPEQRITVEEALRAYTSGAAYASFEERDKGTLARGMLADFVLIDRDLTRIPPEDIRNARVLMTVIGGEVVFERGSRE